MRMAAKAGNHFAMPARLRGAQRIDLPKIFWRVFDHAVGDGNGDIEIGDVVGLIGTFAMLKRDLEGAFLPNVRQRVEMPVRQPLKAEVCAFGSQE